MEKTKVGLLNKLTQQYLNNLQIGENDGNGNFVFCGQALYDDHSDSCCRSYSGLNGRLKRAGSLPFFICNIV